MNKNNTPNDENQTPYGEFTMWTIADDIWTPFCTKKNKLMVSWGYVACRCLGFADFAYKIDKMYVEFENGSAPISAPIPFTKFDSISYYSSLTGVKDYLRLSIDGQPTIEIAPGYETYFGGNSDYTNDPYNGNRLHFSARTTGTAGINGATFGAGVSSVVYGVALVAAPLDSSTSDDVLVSRGYIDSDDQRTVSSGVQIGVTWDLTFPPAD